MNKKVFIVNERAEYCIGTVGQILGARAAMQSLYEAISEMVKEMVSEDWFDDDSVSFTIEIR